MAIQIINDPYRTRGGFGRGITSGLQSILEEMVNKRQQAPAFTAMGIPKDVANKVVNLPMPLQKIFLDQFFSSAAAGGQEPSGGDLQQQLMGLGQPQEQSLMEQEVPQSLNMPELPRTGVPALEQQSSMLANALSPQTQQELRPFMQQQDSFTPKEQKEAEEVFKNIPRTAEFKKVILNPNEASPQARKGLEYQMKPTRQKTFQQLLATPRPSQADILRARGMSSPVTDKEQEKIDKSSQKYYEKVLDDAKDAKMNDMRLNRMKYLNEKGNLGRPRWNAALETITHGIFGIGINLKSLMTADAQEFDKLSKDFLKNAKTIFGARVTEGEIRMFLETVPTLSQTPAARNRVIRNMKMMNEAAKLKKHAMEEIISMNGGERPKNLELLVDKKIGPRMDKLAEAFTLGNRTEEKKGAAAEEAERRRRFPSFADLFR